MARLGLFWGAAQKLRRLGAQTQNARRRRHEVGNFAAIRAPQRGTSLAHVCP